MADKVIDKNQWNYTIVENSLIESDLDIYEKMLYIALKRFANIQTQEAFPGVKKIAQYSGMSERKARSVIRDLEAKQIIKVEHRERQTSVYTLLPLPAPHAGGTAHGAGGVLHHMQGGGAHGAGELKKEELKKVNNKGDVVSLSDDDKKFEEWWNLYNHKVGDKKKCRTRYKSLLKNNRHEKIMIGTERYIRHLTSLKEKGLFAPNKKYPYTFLNGENFNDEYETITEASVPKYQELGDREY